MHHQTCFFTSKFSLKGPSEHMDMRNNKQGEYFFPLPSNIGIDVIDGLSERERDREKESKKKKSLFSFPLFIGWFDVISHPNYTSNINISLSLILSPSPSFGITPRNWESIATTPLCYASAQIALEPKVQQPFSSVCYDTAFNCHFEHSTVCFSTTMNNLRPLHTRPKNRHLIAI